jgi:uncharacterized coiled-coil DUF342 family protein
MDIDKLIEKTQSYRQLRSEIISEIQQIVSKAKVINEILYSVAATEENIDMSEALMDNEINYLSDIDEDIGRYMAQARVGIPEMDMIKFYEVLSHLTNNISLIADGDI